jgi:esterase/lipase superfamily enzyme
MTVSHSMGNRIVFWYLQSRYDSNQGEPSKYSEVVLASPDTDRATSKNYLYKISHNALKTRIYVSAHDEPLKLSRKLLHGGYGRLGDGRAEDGQSIRWEHPGSAANVEMINFTVLDRMKLLGHSLQVPLIVNMHKHNEPGPGLSLKDDERFKGRYRYVIKCK